jgi:hypothetical protein
MNGINEQMLKRYNTITFYSESEKSTKEKNSITIGDVGKDGVIYQKLDKDWMRVLRPIRYYQLNTVDDKQKLFEMSNILALINQYVVNLESFEITSLRINTWPDKNKRKKQPVGENKMGVIENYLKKDRLEDAMWKTFSNSHDVDPVRLSVNIYNFANEVKKVYGYSRRFLRDRNFIKKLNNIL